MATSRCFMFMYFLLPHWVPATWRSRAQTNIRAELPSGKLPAAPVWLAVFSLCSDTPTDAIFTVF